MAKPKLKTVPKIELLKLDFGAGKNKRAGFRGVDIKPFPGVDDVFDLRKPWPWGDETVGEANASHFIEHLDQAERCHFFNELWRVLIPGGKCFLATPHWASNRAYGDPTHKWPPVSEMAWYYLNKEWRTKEAPHTNDMLSCDFDFTAGYALRGDLAVRNQEYQQFAIANYKEVCTDMLCTLTKPEKAR